MPVRRPRAALAVLILAALLPAGTAPAQSRNDPLRFIRWPVDDARGLVSGISVPEVIGAAGVGLVVFGLSHYDRPAVDGLEGLRGTTAMSVAEQLGNPRVVYPMAVLVFTGALLSGKDRFQETAFTSLEALVFANAVTGLIKLSVGRSRPNANLGPGSFEPFSGRVSFPSGHATTAFAALTPWFLSYPGPATAGLLVLAGATAVSRMANDYHWLSDVVAGSAIGFTMAWALTRRHVRLGSVLVEPAITMRSASVRISL